MSFGAAQAAFPAVPSPQGPQANRVVVLGFTLAAFAAAPAAPANADCGEFSTAAILLPNQTALAPTTFGRGQGKWQAGDEQFVHANVTDLSDATQGAAGQLPDPHLVAAFPAVVVAAGIGDLAVRIHNRGLTACLALRIELTYQHSTVR